MYSLIKQNDDVTYNLRDYTCDTENDVRFVPTNCAPGSSLLVIETGNMYLLNTSLTWELVAGGSGAAAVIDDVTPSLTTVYSSTKVTNLLNDIREVAEGKTKTYIVAYSTNPEFNSDESEIEITSLTDIMGVEVAATSLHPGDVILVKEPDVPDRWVEKIEEDIATLSTLEAMKIDLSNYILRSDVTTEPWTFELEDGSTIVRTVMIAGGTFGGD